MERKITVLCYFNCGVQELTDEQYREQLWKEHEGWHCPKCKGRATWQEIQYKCPGCGEFSEGTHIPMCPHCKKCMCCDGSGTVEGGDECQMCPPPGWLESEHGIEWLKFHEGEV